MRRYIFFLSFVLLLASACETWIEGSNQQLAGVQDFEACWKTVDSVYPDFGIKNLSWDAMFEKYYPEALNSSGDEIIEVLLMMLAELRDGHIYLKTAGGEKIFPYIPIRRSKDLDKYDPGIVRNYFPEPLYVTQIGGIEYGITQSNVGYLYISSFGSHIDFDQGFDEILKKMKSTDGLIIDIRHNMGGNGKEVVKVISHFINDSIPNIESWVLREALPRSYISPTEGFYYDKPVVVLINGVSFSAAESFSEIMKSLDEVILIGTQTGGGAFGYYGNTGPVSGNFILPSGRGLHIGTMDLRRYDGLSFEGIGIQPDIQVSNDPMSMEKGNDSQLEYAIEYLKN